MKDNTEKKGIKGWLFILLLVLGLATVFCLSVIFSALSGQMRQEPWSGLDKYFLIRLIDYVLAAAIGMFFIWLFFAKALDISITELKKRFKAEANNSYVIVAGGILISAAIMVQSMGGQTPIQHLYLTLTRGSVGYLMATLVTVIVTRYWGVKTMDQFREQVSKPGQDSYAIWVAVILVFSMILAVA